jgi:PAS domain S-box-containing protein
MMLAMERQLTQQPESPEGDQRPGFTGEADVSGARDTFEAMFTLDVEGRVVSASPSTEAMFGATATDLTGERFEQLVSEPYREEWRAELRRLRRDEQPDSLGDRREVLAQRMDDGAVFPVVLSTASVLNGNLHRFIAVVHDRTRERQLERRLYEAQEQERRRIGHELHDSVGGQLTGVEIASSLLHRSLAGEDSPHAREAAELVEHMRELHSRVREVSRGLLPVEDDPLGLMSALRRLVKRTHGRGGMRCLFRCDGEINVDETGISTNLYHIAEEAVQNSLLHAEAKRITIELSKPEENIIELEVRDDGKGLPPGVGLGSGIGMDSMAHRARLIDGRFELLPNEPSGTRVRCTVDLARRRQK